MAAHKTSFPLASVQRGRLRTVIERLGPEGAARILGVSAPTLLRALSGCNVRKVSRTAITLGMDALDRGDTVAA